MKIISAKDYKDMSRKAANIISAQVILKSDSVLGLATGSTPIGLYKQLADWNQRGDIDFKEVRTFNLDEYVGFDRNHPQSYYRFMHEQFFDHINIDEKNVTLLDGMTKDKEKECHDFEEKIKNCGGIDLQILGIGHNGHIGFNEPSEYFERDTHVVNLSDLTKQVNARFFDNVDEVPSQAISMGMGIIMRAKRIILLCSGADKAKILKESLFGKIDPHVPASILQLHSDITVVADEEALKYIKD